MKKYWIVILLAFVIASCQEDITEDVPLNKHQNPPPTDDNNNDDNSDDDSSNDGGDHTEDPGTGDPGTDPGTGDPGTGDPGTDPGTIDPGNGNNDLNFGVDNSNTMLGNPSNATKEISNENNFLMDKGYFVLSYNRSKAIPNWVSWYVGPSSLGSAKRSDNFRADADLPAAWFKVSDGSYSGSGFSRGHNCPSADRTSTDVANKATFLMTNMIPQNQQNNGGVWGGFEDYIRTQVKAGYEAYIVMGTYGKGGTDASGNYKETIAGGAITVPKMIWKAVVLVQQGNGDMGRITTSTRVIAINTPNIQAISGSWTNFKVSVDFLESETGWDLFAELPDNIENVLEAKIDGGV